VLKKDGWLLLTTLFSFPRHSYPVDYWRFTPSCLEMLFKKAGFDDVESATAGEVHYVLNDHGEDRNSHFYEPRHVFCGGCKP
jgi:hypothetical protein